jgi:hypothetical protein
MVSSWSISSNPKFSADMTEEEAAAEVRRVILHKGVDPIGTKPVEPTPEQAKNTMNFLEEIGLMSDKTLREIIA